MYKFFTHNIAHNIFILGANKLINMNDNHVDKSFENLNLHFPYLIQQFRPRFPFFSFSTWIS